MIRRGLLVVALTLPACASSSAGADPASGQPTETQAGAQSAEAASTSDVTAATQGAAHSDRVLSGRILPGVAVRPESVVVFEPFGPAPGTARADYEAWAVLLVERFYGTPDEARIEALEEELSGLHVADLTPVYIDLVIGLDMADVDDVLLAAELTSDWYQRQLRFKQLVLPGDDGTDMREGMVANRLLVLDAWRRWWERTLADPASVERYRQRIDEQLWELRRVGRGPRGD